MKKKARGKWGLKRRKEDFQKEKKTTTISAQIEYEKVLNGMVTETGKPPKVEGNIKENIDHTETTEMEKPTKKRSTYKCPKAFEQSKYCLSS